MFDFINDHIPTELKRMFKFNDAVHSHETRQAKCLHIYKGTTSRYGLNTLRYDGATLWNQYYKKLLSKENKLTKQKLKRLLKSYYFDMYR